MENSSREVCHILQPGEEIQDETQIELSLGLSLSSSDSRSKRKDLSGASAHSSPSVDPAAESTVGVSLNGMHPVAKPKPANKAGSLDAALKKFLEGRLDDHEDSAKLLDGSSSFRSQKEKDKACSVGSLDKLLDVALDADHKGNPFLFKELQGSSGLEVSRGQSPVHTTPLQLVDAFKSSPLGSNSGSLHSAEGNDSFEGDDATQDTSEHQRDCQDARKKQKHMLEDQKHHKKGEKEDNHGTHGFHIPDRITTVSASANDMDNLSVMLRGDAGNEQLQQDASQEKQDSAKAEKWCESGGGESTGFAKNVSAGLGLNDTKGISDESRGVEVNFVPQLRALGRWQKTAEHPEDNSPWPLTLMKSQTTSSKLQEPNTSLKGACSSPSNQRDRKALVIGREGDNPSSLLLAKRERVPSETSSVSTGGTEKMEEKSWGEASSSIPEVTGSNKGPLLASASAGPFCPPVEAPRSASVPHPVSSNPVVRIPYTLPVPIPHTSGMPFPVGVNFPYMMQYLPTRAENIEQNHPTQPVGHNIFQQSGSAYQPHLWEGTSWIQRPPVSPYLNTSNGALYNRNGILEDANIQLQAGTRVQDNEVVNTSIAADNSSRQNHGLVCRAAVCSGTQEQRPEASSLSSLPIPAVPHFTSHLGIPDHGELQTSKEQNCMTFPGFSAAVQVAQTHPSPGPARSPSSSVAKEDARPEQGMFGGGRAMPPVIQHLMQNRNILETSMLGQEEFRRAAGSHFHQGNTEYLSSVDGLGEDTSFLKFGLAPELKFGGSGIAPDLPWVHTTSSNGQTIGGVLYRLNRSQLRVVCACHGKHMSPVEFAQHAGSVDIDSVDKNGTLNSPLTTHTS